MELNLETIPEDFFDDVLKVYTTKERYSLIVFIGEDAFEMSTMYANRPNEVNHYLGEKKDFHIEFLGRQLSFSEIMCLESGTLKAISNRLGDFLEGIDNE